jgi:cytidylate kinase
MPARVIAISRTNGSGGEAVGLEVAKELGFQYIDEEIIPIAAEKAGVDPMIVADEERRKGLIARFVQDLGAGGMAMSAGGAYWMPDDSAGRARSDDFRSLIRETIAEVAAGGRAVIVAHAASMALAGRDDVLRVLVTSSKATRVRRVAEEQEVSDADAAKLIERSDADRADYLDRFYDIDQELPTHYDLVINTDTLVPETAAGVIVRAAGA